MVISDKVPVRNRQTEVVSGQKDEGSENVGNENKKKYFYAKNSAEEHRMD